MKNILFACLLLVALSSCASSLNKARQLAKNEQVVPSDDPCTDSLFLAIKNKPYASLTAFEHHYYEMMFDKCYNTPVVNESGPAEWWVAAPIIISIAVAVVYFFVSRL